MQAIKCPNFFLPENTYTTHNNTTHLEHTPKKSYVIFRYI